MGFDAETKDGHHIYWLEKRSVTVERSVKFNFEDEVEIPILPLETENIQQSKITPVETSEKDDEERDTIEEKIPLTKGRGKQIQKESEYIRRLREGVLQFFSFYEHMSNMPYSFCSIIYMHHFMDIHFTCCFHFCFNMQFTCLLFYMLFTYGFHASYMRL